MPFKEEFHIWVNGEKLPVASPTSGGPAGVEKFKTCIHRSEEQEIEIKSCCSTTRRNGYKCSRLGIDFVHAGICATCAAYEKKGG